MWILNLFIFLFFKKAINHFSNYIFKGLQGEVLSYNFEKSLTFQRGEWFDEALS